MMMMMMTRHDNFEQIQIVDDCPVRLYIGACTSHILVRDSPLRLDNTPPETLCLRRSYTYSTCTLDHCHCDCMYANLLFSSNNISRKQDA
jgi:hypothetical protein